MDHFESLKAIRKAFNDLKNDATRRIDDCRSDLAELSDGKEGEYVCTDLEKALSTFSQSIDALEGALEEFDGMEYPIHSATEEGCESLSEHLSKCM